MADLPPSVGAGEEAGSGPDRGSSSGTPRWVKVFVIIGLVVVLLFLVAKLTGLGGDHGPGRHGGGGDTPSTVIEEHGGHRAPVDHSP